MVQQIRNAPEDDLDRLIRMREEIKTLEVRQAELCGVLSLPDKIKALKDELQTLAVDRLVAQDKLRQIHEKQKKDMSEKIEGELSGLVKARDEFAVEVRELEKEIEGEAVTAKILKETITGFYEENKFLADVRSKLNEEITVLKETLEVTKKEITDASNIFFGQKRTENLKLEKLEIREDKVTGRENKVERREREFAASEKAAKDEINGLISAYTIERDDFNKKRSAKDAENSGTKSALVGLHKDLVTQEEALDRKDQNLAINEKNLGDWQKTLEKREQDLKTNQEAFTKREAEIKWEKGRK